jgi:hypothetical protein
MVLEEYTCRMCYAIVFLSMGANSQELHIDRRCRVRHFVQLVAYVHYYGQNVPYWDEWELNLDIAQKTVTGNLQLADLFTQHSAHRSVFTFAVIALNTALFRWDLRIDMYVSVALSWDWILP